VRQIRRGSAAPRSGGTTREPRGTNPIAIQRFVPRGSRAVHRACSAGPPAERRAGLCACSVPRFLCV